MEKKMVDLRIRPQDLAQERNVPGVPGRDGKPWTVDELLSIYAGMKNERSRRAILYGNFKGRLDPEADAAECVKNLRPEEKALADAVIEEYERHFDRIDAALIAVYNKGMDHEENYTPMRRLEYTTAEGLMDPDSAEAMMDAREKAGGMGRVERGFQKNRVDMSQKNQRGIDLGLFSIWNSQVEVQEHAAAFAGLIRDMRRILVGRNTQTQEATVQQRLKETYGKAAWESVKNYFNIIGKNDRKLAHDVLDGASKWMVKNMSTAYLCANLGTMLKQTTSFPRFLPYCGPVQWLVSIGEFARDHKAFLEQVYEWDPQLRARQGNLILDAMRSAGTGASGLYQKALDLGMSGITLADKLTTAIGWKAVYNANIKKGLSHDAAVREAQRAVILTQPTVHAKDAPAVWKANGLTRLAMAFTNDMAQTFGITMYDLDAAVRRGDVPKFFATLLSVVLAAGMMGYLTTGGPDDDNDESLALWWAKMTGRQMAESIPLLGKGIIALWDSRGRSIREVSPYLAPFADLLKGVFGLWDDKEGNNERAVMDLMEAGALLSGFPSTGLSRLWRAGKTAARGDVKNAMKRAIGMRVQEKKLRGRAGM
ncbi:MAG: hypothetical protein IJU98_08260 [Synergistaceae bacterium]|nr:hypothetical protein [Synergistaceae bacterium]